MKLINICIFLFLISCATSNGIIAISSKKFHDSIIVESNCKKKIFFRKEDKTPLSGEVNIKLEEGYSLKEVYSEGQITQQLVLSPDLKTIEKTLYSDIASYITTLYDMYAFQLLPYNKDYDSISYHFENGFLQEIDYYQNDVNTKTTISYTPGLIEVNSTTEKFYFDPVQFGEMTIDCPYDKLMKDSVTGDLIDRIKIIIKTPATTFSENYSLQKDKSCYYLE